MAPSPSTRTERPTTSDPVDPVDPADEDTAGRLGLAVMRLARHMRQETTSDVTASQLSALSIVAKHGPITMTELAERENVAPPTMTRIVAALETGGWVRREPDATDRRVIRIRATDRATRELARVRAERTAFLATKLTTLDADARSAVLAAIPALEQLLLEGDR